MKRSRVNVLSVINSASNITTETIDGNEHIVVKNICPLYDNCVLNGGLYPTEENDKGYLSLNEVPMPYGHPKIDGKYVSSRDVRALNNHWIGAYSLNPRKEGGKVLVDMRVNRRIAEGTDHGKEVLERLDAMINGETTEPISISTGLNLSKIQANGKAPNGKAYSWIATNQQYDHIAILLNEPPAGTPEEGIGMFVNAQGEELSVEQVNLSESVNLTKANWWEKTKFYLTNASNYSFEEICAAIRNKMSEGKPENYYFYPDGLWPDRFVYEEDGKYLQQKYLIDDDGKAVFVGEPVEVVRKPAEYEEVQTNKEQSPMKDLIINALKAAGKPTDGKTDAELMDAYNQMKADEATAKKKDEEGIDPETGKPKKKESTTNSDELKALISSAVNEAVAPLREQLQANADTERKEMRDAVKAKFGLSETAVNAMTDEPLKEMFSQCQTTLGLNSRFPNSVSTESISNMPE
jgi:DNA-binding protein YbaB